jgi:hypothetical protein
VKRDFASVITQFNLFIIADTGTQRSQPTFVA